MAITNFLSIDVEDYFQVSAFENISPPSSWGQRELRVEQNTEKILCLLNEARVKATFFVLGWVAKRCPSLVQTIAREGHEVASHGYWHQRIPNLRREEFREDIRRSKKLLENLIGQEIQGYRAPSYSISKDTFWAFDELFEAGYRYDSSVFPIRHDFYGIPNWPRFSGFAVRGDDCQWQPADALSDGRSSLREIPITTIRLIGKNLPIAGGGYFRLIPYSITRLGLNRINRCDKQPFVFYLHPWELDPQQPRMIGCSAKSRFRHYLNLSKVEARFRRLLKDFHFKPLGETL